MSEVEKLLKELGMSLDELVNIAIMKSKGRLAILPCRPGDKVYTIDKDECPCDICSHGREFDFNSRKCLEDDRSAGCFKECPPPRYSIIEHICEGFTISEDADGNPVVSKPGEWGYEGLEQFYGCDGKVYYDYEAAKEAVEALRGNE